jgi:hypothetical protein
VSLWSFLKISFCNDRFGLKEKSGHLRRNKMGGEEDRTAEEEWYYSVK